VTFLLPAALAAMALAAVPILLHFLRREEVEERSFPALRYFPPEVRDRDRNLRIRERLLLLLRTLAVVIAVLAAARWIVPLAGGSDPPADFVIIVEEGIASGAVVEGRRILDAQVALASDLVSALGERDLVWIVPTTAPGSAVRPLPPGEALEVLALLEPVAAPSRTSEALERASGILSARPPGPRQVVVVRSDGTRRTAPYPHPLVEVDPGIPFPPNRGIVAVEIGSGLAPRAGEGIELRVRVEDGAGAAIVDLPVRFVEEGGPLAVARTGADGAARLALPPRGPGTLVGHVEIDPDALRLDDRVPVRIEVLEAPEVRLVGPPNPWIETALAALAEGDRIRFQGRTPGGEGGAGTLLETGAVRILLPPGDPTGLPAFNLRLEGEGIPVRLTAPAPNDAFAVLRPAPALPPALEGLELRRILSPAELPAGVTAAARDSRGIPWLVEAPGGGGDSRPVRVLAFPLEPSWNGIPESVAMVPLLDRLLHPSPLPPDGAGGDTAEAPPPLVVATPPVPRAVPAEGPPPERWSRRLLAERRGREATPFLPWLLLAILLLEGRLASATWTGARTHPEAIDPS
jgi:hypothetical protein